MPAFCLRCSRARLKVTGAAWNLFFVNTAAAAHGTSDASSARSGFVVFPGFTPTIVPDARNPRGYVPDVGTYFRFAAGTLPPTGAEYVRIEVVVAVVATPVAVATPARRSQRRGVSPLDSVLAQSLEAIFRGEIVCDLAVAGEVRSMAQWLFLYRYVRPTSDESNEEGSHVTCGIAPWSANVDIR